MKKISIIVAMSKNSVIGLNNKLPWHISEDLKNFKQLTLNNSVIMGRKTYDSIGKLLKDRNNIVISRDPLLKINNVKVKNSLDKAISSVEETSEIFIIGGSDLYSQTINIANKLYLTSINHEISGDKYFPAFDIDQWKLIDSCSYKKNNSNSHHFKSEIFIRKT